MNEIDPPIGDDTFELQQRMGGKEIRERGSDRALKSERTTQSNKPARLSLHAKRGLLGGLGFDDRRTRMFEDLLAHLGQTKPSRRPIEQTHAEPLLQQSDAPTDARFGDSKRASGCREPAIENDSGKELEIVKVAHHCSFELSVIFGPFTLTPRVNKLTLLAPASRATPATEKTIAQRAMRSPSRKLRCGERRRPNKGSNLLPDNNLAKVGSWVRAPGLRQPPAPARVEVLGAEG